MPRTLTPAIRKSDSLAAESAAPRIPTREDVERMFAAKDKTESKLGQVWWHGDGEPEGTEDEGQREFAAAFRRGE
jgi:hypothetical protein